MLNKTTYIGCILLPALLAGPCLDCSAGDPPRAAALQSLLDNARAQAQSMPRASDSLAASVLQQSLALKNDSLSAKAYYTLGVANYFAGRHLLSQHYYKKALESPYARGHPGFRASLLNNLGIIMEYQGQLGDAADSYHQSMKVAEELGDSLGVYQSCINLGLVNLHLASLEAAGGYLHRALRYFSRTGDTYNQALCLHNMAVLHSERKDYGQMERCFREARALYEAAGIREKVLEVTVDELYLLTQAGRLEQAGWLLPRLQAAAGAVNPYVAATAAMARGNYLALAGEDYQEAERCYREAESGFRGLKAYTKLVTLFEHYMELCGKTGDYARQREVLEEYQHLLKEKYKSETAEKVAGLLALAELEKEERGRGRTAAREAGGRHWLWWLLSAAGIIGALTAFYKYSRHPRGVVAGQPYSQGQQAAANDTPVFSDPPVAGAFPEELESSASNLFEKVAKHVNGNKRYLDPHLKITDIAFELGTNEKYISQAVSQGARTKFVDYIAGLRVREAKRLLEEHGSNPLSIKEIAMKSGFGNQPQFQRKFKELTGMTPLAFREACHKKASGS